MIAVKRDRSGLIAAVVFIVVWGLTTHGKYSVSGDEPHYLIVAESLWSDGDLDVQDEYGSGVSRVFGHDDLAVGDHARRDLKGILRPVHDVGLPATLVPIYGAAVAVSRAVPESWLAAVSQTPGLFAYSLISLSMLVLTCLSLCLLMGTLTSAVSQLTAAAVVLSVGLSPPILSNAFLVFPEVVAFAVVCLALYASYSERKISVTDLMFVAAALGVLPWFHRKFVLLALGLLFIVIVRRRNVLRELAAPQIWGLALVFGGPQLALAGWSLAQWGHLGGPLMIDRAPFSLDAFRVGIFGLLVDRENGLFVWAPLYLTLPAAWWMTRSFSLVLLVPSILLIVPSAAHDQWWGGFSPAARFLVPLVPIFALVIAHAVKNRTFAMTWYALLLPQFILSAYCWQNARQL